MHENIRCNDRNRKKILMFFKNVFRAAKVAKRLINLMQYETKIGTTIMADFAECNESQFDERMPKLFTMQPVDSNKATSSDVVKCFSCSMPGTNMSTCAKCFTENSATFYCDRVCQVRDWSVHKRKCKPLPRLTNVEDLKLEEKQKQKFLVPFVEEFPDMVVLTHVQSHSNVLFVRPARGNFEELLASIGKISAQVRLSEKPEIDDTVLAPLNGTYHRAQIIDVFEKDEKENDVQVFFIDFGSLATVSWQKLRKLTFKGRNLPRQTFKVVLEDGDVSNPSDPEFKKYLELLCLRQLELKVVKMNLRCQDRYVTLEELHSGKVVNDFVKTTFSPTDDDTRIFFDVSMKIFKVCS